MVRKRKLEKCIRDNLPPKGSPELKGRGTYARKRAVALRICKDVDEYRSFYTGEVILLPELLEVDERMSGMTGEDAECVKDELQKFAVSAGLITSFGSFDSRKRVKPYIHDTKDGISVLNVSRKDLNHALKKCNMQSGEDFEKNAELMNTRFKILIESIRKDDPVARMNLKPEVDKYIEFVRSNREALGKINDVKILENIRDLLVEITEKYSGNPYLQSQILINTVEALIREKEKERSMVTCQFCGKKYPEQDRQWIGYGDEDYQVCPSCYEKHG